MPAIETETPDLHRQLDQRGRLALCAGDDGLGGLCRRFHHRRHSRAARTSTASAFGEALDSIGYRGDEAGRRAANSAPSFELHIEQGPILEAENKTIGVVDRGQGMLWYDGKITGFESHAGTTPMPLRRDALATLSEDRAGGGADREGTWPERGRHRRRGRDRQPSRNVIPGEIAFTVDCPQPRCRHPRRHRQGFARRDRRDRGAAQGRVKFDLIWRKPPTISIPSWSTRSRTPPRRSAIAIAASPPAPATTPATSTL